MPDDLSDRLRSTALCETTHPADAVTALMVAATTILCARFEPTAVVELIRAATAEALTLQLLMPPAGSA